MQVCLRAAPVLAEGGAAVPASLAAAAGVCRRSRARGSCLRERVRSL